MAEQTFEVTFTKPDWVNQDGSNRIETVELKDSEIDQVTNQLERAGYQIKRMTPTN